MNIDSFTYITGVATLLGLGLQLKDSFPGHREARKTVVLLVIGVFVGSLIASLKGMKVEFGTTVTPIQVLIAIFVAVLASVAIIGAFTKEQQRRAELFVFTGFGTFALFILLLFSGIGALNESRAMLEKQQITLEELLSLSAAAESSANYERALLLLSDAKARLPSNDERLKALEGREREIKRKQVGLP